MKPYTEYLVCLAIITALGLVMLTKVQELKGRCVILTDKINTQVMEQNQRWEGME